MVPVMPGGTAAVIVTGFP
jgi:hypothetical protein